MDSNQNIAFTQLLHGAVRQAEALGYRPNDFKRMLSAHGGYETVQRVLATGKPSDGFTRLWELGRLDLTCEALVVESQWRRYFDPGIIQRAEALLLSSGYAYTAFSDVEDANSDESDHETALSSEQQQATDETAPISGEQLRINAFFRDVLSSPVRNERWSWGALDDTRRRVYLRLWQDEITQVDGNNAIRVLSQRKSDRLGWAERQRHLQLIENGYQGFGVLCIKSSNPNRRIESFDASQLVALGNFVRRDDTVYMQLGDTVPVDQLNSPPSSRSTLQGDLADITDQPIPETTRSTLVDARLGQGRFRRDLMKRWDGACAVTGCGIAALLRASHCKPWRDSDNKERLDPHNGLLLTANLDALFDANLISFNDDGSMQISNALTGEERQALGLPASLRKKPSAKLQEYLRLHRTKLVM